METVWRKWNSGIQIGVKDLERYFSSGMQAELCSTSSYGGRHLGFLSSAYVGRFPLHVDCFQEPQKHG